MHGQALTRVEAESDGLAFLRQDVKTMLQLNRSAGQKANVVGISQDIVELERGWNLSNDEVNNDIE